MINNDSIVTAYDEHLTLVEWLQKVENALDNAVLTNLGIAKLSDQGNIATYRVTATFADNTTIVSDTFTLPSTNIVTAFNDLTALVNGFDTRITDNTNNIARALFTPSSAPSTRKVVTIDTNGAQDNVDGTDITTLMNNIVDSHGNKRFIEGSITLIKDNRVTLNFGKWSLSGTHFMAVAVLDIASGDAESGLENFLILNNLPEWLLAKIVPLGDNVIDFKEFNGYSTSSISSVIFSKLFYFTKYGDNRLRILPSGFILPKTTANSVMRIQFDLMLDSE